MFQSMSIERRLKTSASRIAVMGLALTTCFLGSSAMFRARPLAAAERVVVGANAGDITVVVQESNDSRTVVRFEIAAFTKEPVQIGEETYYKIQCGKAPVLLEAGEPALPRVCRSIIIPDDGEVMLDVLSAEYTDFAETPVAPSKGNLPRTINPDDVPYTFGQVYDSPRWYPRELASLRDPFILRDFRGTVIELNAFQYHPASNVLRVYTSVTVEVVSTGSIGRNVLKRREPFTKVVAEFDAIYERRFINYRFVKSRYQPVEETGDMLIITYDDFGDAMLPFVEWKKQKGIPTSVADVSVIGNNSTAIKNYIQDVYVNNPDLAWVLLVGDANQVATPSACGGSADPTYAKLDADDYPDIIVGRFSAETVAHVQTQVERTIEYEKFPQTGADWYHKGMGIASDEGPGHQGEYDREHMDLIREDLLGFTYTKVDRVYDPGALPMHVRLPLNLEGRSIINYCGHGSRTRWTTSGVSNVHVNALYNVGRLPFIFSVACLNGQFAEGLGPCFAETWLRARLLGGEPTGALATYMSSVGQYWDPPMTAQDEAVDLLCGLTNTTFGGICFNGSCKMIEDYGSAGDDMFSTWHIFGDPSVQLRTDTPVAMSVYHEGWAYSNQQYYEVEVAGAEKALCALYSEGTLYGSAYTEASGEAAIQLAYALPVDQSVRLTVTAFNKLNYIADIQVMPGGDSCEYVERRIDDMNLYWHEENPPIYYYTEETRNVRDGEGGMVSGVDRIWFLMDMKADETIRQGQFYVHTVNYFGLIACYDLSTCDTLYTIRLPEYGSLMPQAQYFGLAYNENDGTFWYCRP
ncbi:MAG: hypothetical protein KAV87_03990, partial [Desulfobacteraceae bacterium]|nr:hypothetical protein [Desulfobacteraceae bacterium]